MIAATVNPPTEGDSFSNLFVSELAAIVGSHRCGFRKWALNLVLRSVAGTARKLIEPF
jgi:hypothetical protein